MATQATKSNSDAGMVQTAQNAQKTHEWPDEAGYCSDEVWAIYKKNQCFRAYDDWNVADLFELARVSRMQAAAIEMQDILDDEGYIVFGGRGGDTPLENPRARVVNTINGSINNVLRRLGITSSNVTADRNSSAMARRAANERSAAQSATMEGDKDERSASALM